MVIIILFVKNAVNPPETMKVLILNRCQTNYDEETIHVTTFTQCTMLMSRKRLEIIEALTIQMIEQWTLLFEFQICSEEKNFKIIT